MVYNRIQVAFGALRKIRGPSLQWQYNEKQYLVIKGLDLPEYYAVDFCNEGDADTITMTPTENGVEIPDQFLLTGKPLVAYVVVVDGESINTIGQITFPVNVRGRRTDISPEPAEQQQIDALIDTLNHAVDEAEDSMEEAGRHAEDAESNATLSESWAVCGTGTRLGEDTNNAKYYSDLSAQSAEESGYAWFDVHDDDGIMYVYISDNLSEDVSFEVNENTGVLEVTYN